MGIIQRNLKIGSPAYKAGLDKGDVITIINETPFSKGESFKDYIETLAVGDSLSVRFERFGVEKTTQVVLTSDPTYHTFLLEKEGDAPSAEILASRKNWLKTE